MGRMEAAASSVKEKTQKSGQQIENWGLEAIFQPDGHEGDPSADWKIPVGLEYWNYSLDRELSISR